MSFLAEVIHPACWIILHLQYCRPFSSTVNEGGPELPRMTGSCKVYHIIITIAIIYYYYYYYYHYYYYYPLIHT